MAVSRRALPLHEMRNPQCLLGSRRVFLFQVYGYRRLSAQTFQNGLLVRFGLRDQTKLHARALDSIAPEGA